MEKNNDCKNCKGFVYDCGLYKGLPEKKGLCAFKSAEINGFASQADIDAILGLGEYAPEKETDPVRGACYDITSMK